CARLLLSHGDYYFDYW
nr:immunoglobulin heavy chain junction region [Mus musculus]